MIESVYTNTRCSQAVPAGGGPYWVITELVGAHTGLPTG